MNWDKYAKKSKDNTQVGAALFRLCARRDYAQMVYDECKRAESEAAGQCGR